jgi:Mn-containing catalase
MYQSFNFRSRDKLRQYYALIANIATEELGHIELVAATVNSLLNGIPSEGDPAEGVASFKQAFKDACISHHHIAMGHGIMCANSMGQPWRGDYIFNSGNLILDLLHNFFLENGARTQKLRVYEMTDNPSARQMLGYLFVRGGVHAHAYALALKQLTGVEMKKMLPIPKIENVALPESKPFEQRGFHRKLYRFTLSRRRRCIPLRPGRRASQ